ncbi:MAG: hypothetical protein V4519_01455 [Patescibacteria group bacterium]
MAFETPQENNFGEKLYSPRDIDGNKNSEIIEQVRDLEERLTPYPWFIGVSPFGSTMKGYSNEESDLDVRILYDEPILKTSDDLELYRNMNEWAAQFKGKTGRDLNVLLEPIDSNRVREYFTIIKNRSFAPIPSELVNMCKMTTGHVIDAYRSSMVAGFSMLGDKQKDFVLSGLLNEFKRDEYASLEKFKNRVDSKNHQEYFQERMELWKHRIEEVFQYTPARWDY